MSNIWNQYQSSSNLLKKTYVNNFLDVSGEMYIRNGTINVDGNINATGDVTCKNLYMITGALDSGINSDVQNALNGKQNKLTAGNNITINGNEISTTGVSNTSNGVYMDRNVIINGNLSVTGNVVVSGTNIHTSDDRLKTNEKTITNSLEYINKLTPQIYNKKKSFDSSNNTIKESGLIAQDIWYNAPELRHLVNVNESWKIRPMELNDNIQTDPSYNDYGWPDKPAAVNYIGLISYLVKSVQELNYKYEQNQVLINNHKAK